MTGFGRASFAKDRIRPRGRILGNLELTIDTDAIDFSPDSRTFDYSVIWVIFVLTIDICR